MKNPTYNTYIHCKISEGNDFEVPINVVSFNMSLIKPHMDDAHYINNVV